MEAHAPTSRSEGSPGGAVRWPGSMSWTVRYSPLSIVTRQLLWMIERRPPVRGSPFARGAKSRSRASGSRTFDSDWIEPGSRPSTALTARTTAILTDSCAPMSDSIRRVRDRSVKVPNFFTQIIKTVLLPLPEMSFRSMPFGVHRGVRNVNLCARDVGLLRARCCGNRAVVKCDIPRSSPGSAGPESKPRN